MTATPAPGPTPGPGKPNENPTAHRAHGAYGDELLRELREGWAPLPTQTLFSMAMAGLRVRLMRSVVTMLSIVLAIAFLTYTGMSSYLSRNLANAMLRYERQAPIAPEVLNNAASSIDHANLFPEMSVDQQLTIAQKWGLADITKDEAEMVGMPGIITSAKLNLNKANATFEKVKADPKAMKLELDAAKFDADAAGDKLAEFVARQKELANRITMGKWITAGGLPTDRVMATQMEHALVIRQHELAAVSRDLNKANATDLAQLIDLLQLTAPADRKSADIITESLTQERSKRNATELGKLLRRAGINVDAAMKGSLMDTWLIVMAMLTCAVGIANAMLMSVTERFREIGTMKCLGAQDNLVVKLFLLESGFLGGIGAFFGVVLGLLVALVAAILQFGLFWHDGFATVGQASLVVASSLLGGILLSVVGAVYPAFAASRMRPVDALRVDE